MGVTLRNDFSDAIGSDLSFRILHALKPAGLTQTELVQCLGGDVGSKKVGRGLANLECARLVTRIVIGANDQWWLCREGLLSAISQFNDCLNAIPEEQDAVLRALGGKTAKTFRTRKIFYIKDRVFVLQAVSARPGTISEISQRIRINIPVMRINDCLKLFESVDLVSSKTIQVGMGLGSFRANEFSITDLGLATLRVLADAESRSITPWTEVANPTSSEAQ